jgi:hypothetical protein
MLHILTELSLDTKTKYRLILGIATIAVLVVPTAAYAAGFLDIRVAVVKVSPRKVDSAAMVTDAIIPKDGSGGAFGYGILTGDSIIVSTTHAGVLDSKAQNGDKNNPVFHNHYVHLGPDRENCGNNPRVTAITFASPGKVTVAGSLLVLQDLPKTSDGLSQDGHVNRVVSFVLEVNGPAVCVTQIQDADRKLVL